MPTPAPFVAPFYLSDAGAPLAAGLLYTYDAGTVTPKTTYSDSAGTVPNANPIVLDSAGRASIYLAAGGYKLVLKDAAGVTIWTRDYVNSSGIDGTIQVVDTIAQLKALPGGSSNYVQVGGYYAAGDGGGGYFRWLSTSTAADDAGVTITPSSLPASGRWIRVYDGDISVKWFGAKGDGVTNDYAALAATNTYANSLATKGTILFPAASASYVHNSNFTVSDGVMVRHEVGGIISTPVGIVLLTPQPMAGRFKIYTGVGTQAFKQGRANVIFPEWWGAVADLGVGDTDSTAAIQSAVTAHMQQPVTGGYNYGGKVLFGTGTYLISAKIRIPNNVSPVHIVGQGKLTSLIRVKTGSTAFPNNAMFEFPNNADVLSPPSATTVSNYTSGSIVEGITLDGNSIAGYGLLAFTNNSTFRDLRFTRFTNAGCDVSWGWANYYEKCVADGNSGDGFRFNTLGSDNSLIMVGCVSFNNSGYGVVIGEGNGFAMYNCTIETNAKIGIYMTGNVRGFTVDTCYFESNGATGHVFTQASDGVTFASLGLPNVTIRADILINGTKDPDFISPANECTGSILNSTVSAGAAVYHVYGPAQNGLVIQGCRRGTDPIILFGTYGNHSTTAAEFSYSNTDNLQIGVNNGWGSATSPIFDISPLSFGILKTSPTNMRIGLAGNRNLVESNMSKWSLISGGAGGSFFRSADIFPYDPLADVYEMRLDAVGTSAFYGFTIDPSLYPQYDDKFFVFSFWAKHTDIADLTATLRIGTPAIDMDYYTGTPIGWQLISGIFKWDSSAGPFAVGVLKTTKGAGANGAAYIANPVLCEAGSDFKTLQGQCFQELVYGVNAGQGASTTQTQGQVPIYKPVNLVTTVANENDVVTLPPAIAGRPCFVRNNGANTLQIFPASGDTIDGAAANASVFLEAGESVLFIGGGTTNWDTYPRMRRAFKSLVNNTASVGNVLGGEDDLITYSMPANTLRVNGDRAVFETAGTFANATVRLRAYLGADLLFDSGAFASGGAADWRMRVTIIRTGAATQLAIVEFQSTVAAIDSTCDYTEPGRTLSAANIFKLTGESTTAATNDIIQKFLLGELKPAT